VIVAVSVLPLFSSLQKESSDLNVCSVFIPSGDIIPLDLFRTKISAYDTFISPVWVTNELLGGSFTNNDRLWVFWKLRVLWLQLWPLCAASCLLL